MSEVEYEVRGPELWWCVTPPTHSEYAYPVKGCDVTSIVGIGALPDSSGPEIRLVFGYGYALIDDNDWRFSFDLEEAYAGIEEMIDNLDGSALQADIDDRIDQARNDEPPEDG